MIQDLTTYAISEEGFRPLVYDDRTGQLIKPGSQVLGHPTIGYGQALDVNPITKVEALMMLQNRLSQAELDAKIILGGEAWRPLADPRRAVLALMVYQLGPSGLLQFVKMIDAIRHDDWNGAAAEALRSKWASQTPARAERAAFMLKMGEWPNA